MSSKKVTMTDIANAAGVSQSTVSHILRQNNLSSFPSQTIERVMNCASEMGYVMPRRNNSGAVQNMNKCILVLATSMTYPYYPFLLHCIESEALKSNIKVVCCDTYHSKELEEAYLKMALDFKFIAVIYLYPPDNFEALNRAVASMLVITICDKLAESKADQVELDNYKSGYLAAEHLISLGHRNIALLTNSLEDSIARSLRAKGAMSKVEEMPGCRLTVIAHNKTIDDDNSGNTDYNYGYQLAHDKKLRECEATAIIAINDMVAIGAMNALIGQGYKIPDDYSIIGFDNLIYTGLERVSLTTIDPHADLLAMTAMNVLMHRINTLSPDPLIASTRFKAETQPRLIKRNSTGNHQNFNF